MGCHRTSDESLFEPMTALSDVYMREGGRKWLAFGWKYLNVCFDFHERLFPSVESTVSQHWFRYVNRGYVPHVPLMYNYWRCHFQLFSFLLRPLYQCWKILMCATDNELINPKDFQFPAPFAPIIILCCTCTGISLRWHHNERDGVSNHQRLDGLLNHLFRRRSKKTSKLRVTDLCEGNSPVTGEFPAQRASNADNLSIWWRHHV